MLIRVVKQIDFPHWTTFSFVLASSFESSEIYLRSRKSFYDAIPKVTMKEGNRLLVIRLLKRKGKVLVISTQNASQGAVRLGLRIDTAIVVGNDLNCNGVFHVSFTIADGYNA